MIFSKKKYDIPKKKLKGTCAMQIKKMKTVLAIHDKHDKKTNLQKTTQKT